MLCQLVLEMAANHGLGQSRTDVHGRYRFWTLRPGPYGDDRRRRAPHIHFQVTGCHDRLVTQMFLPGEALNTADHLYRSASRPELLLATILFDEPASLLLCWDIVLSNG